VARRHFDRDEFAAHGTPVAHTAAGRSGRPRDGDGDGFVYDGTPRMRPFNPLTDVVGKAVKPEVITKAARGSKRDQDTIRQRTRANVKVYRKAGQRLDPDRVVESTLDERPTSSDRRLPEWQAAERIVRNELGRIVSTPDGDRDRFRLPDDPRPPDGPLDEASDAELNRYKKELLAAAKRERGTIGGGGGEKGRLESEAAAVSALQARRARESGNNLAAGRYAREVADYLDGVVNFRGLVHKGKYDSSTKGVLDYWDKLKRPSRPSRVPDAPVVDRSESRNPDRRYVERLDGPAVPEEPPSPGRDVRRDVAPAGPGWRGDPPTPEQLTEAFTVDFGDGYNTEVTRVDPDGFVNGIILDSDGVEVGTFRRWVAPDAPVVEFESLKLHRDHQGRGLGGRFFAESVDRLRELGVERIDVQASSWQPNGPAPGEPQNGAYTWARMGYDWAPGSTSHILLARELESMTARGVGSPADLAAASDMAARLRQVDAIPSNPADLPDDFPTPNDVAVLGWDPDTDMGFGKMLMTGLADPGRRVTFYGSYLLTDQPADDLPPSRMPDPVPDVVPDPDMAPTRGPDLSGMVDASPDEVRDAAKAAGGPIMARAADNRRSRSGILRGDAVQVEYVNDDWARVRNVQANGRTRAYRVRWDRFNGVDTTASEPPATYTDPPDEIRAAAKAAGSAMIRARIGDSTLRSVGVRAGDVLDVEYGSDLHARVRVTRRGRVRAYNVPWERLDGIDRTDRPAPEVDTEGQLPFDAPPAPDVVPEAPEVPPVDVTPEPDVPEPDAPDGPRWDKPTAEALFVHDLGDGYTSEISFVSSIPRADGGGDLGVVGDVKFNGEPVGTFSRRMDSEGFVTMEDLQLLPGHTGKGVGTRFIAKSIDAAREAGYDRVEVKAASGDGMNGAYTWARFGYDWATPGFGHVAFATRIEKALAGEVDGITVSDADRPALVAMLDRLGGPGLAAKAKADGWASVALRDTPDEFPTPGDVAMLGWTEGADDWIGKQLLDGRFGGVAFTGTYPLNADPRVSTPPDVPPVDVTPEPDVPEPVAPERDPRFDAVTREMPAGAKLYHSTRSGNVANILADGIRPSANGESGPGVYLTEGDPYQGFDPSTHTLLEATSRRPLRLLDRGTPEGEAIYRELHPGYREPDLAKLRDAGFDGVAYPGVGGRNPEVIVHDPDALDIGIAATPEPNAPEPDAPDAPDAPTLDPTFADIAPDGKLYRAYSEGERDRYGDHQGAKGAIYWTGVKSYAENYGNDVDEIDLPPLDDIADVRDPATAQQMIDWSAAKIDELDALLPDIGEPGYSREGRASIRDAREALALADANNPWSAGRVLATVGGALNQVENPEDPWRSGTGEKRMMDELDWPAIVAVEAVENRDAPEAFSFAFRDMPDVPERTPDTPETPAVDPQLARELESRLLGSIQPSDAVPDPYPAITRALADAPMNDRPLFKGSSYNDLPEVGGTVNFATAVSTSDAESEAMKLVWDTGEGAPVLFELPEGAARSLFLADYLDPADPDVKAMLETQREHLIGAGEYPVVSVERVDREGYSPDGEFYYRVRLGEVNTAPPATEATPDPVDVPDVDPNDVRGATQRGRVSAVIADRGLVPLGIRQGDRVDVEYLDDDQARVFARTRSGRVRAYDVSWDRLGGPVQDPEGLDVTPDEPRPDLPPVVVDPDDVPVSPDLPPAATPDVDAPDAPPVTDAPEPVELEPGSTPDLLRSKARDADQLIPGRLDSDNWAAFGFKRGTNVAIEYADDEYAMVGKRKGRLSQRPDFMVRVRWDDLTFPKRKASDARGTIRERAERIAEQHGVPVDIAEQAIRDLPSLRNAAKADMAAAADNAINDLDVGGVPNGMRMPPDKKWGRLATGGEGWINTAGGEWDWFFEGLAANERARLRRNWLGQSSITPDELPDIVAPVLGEVDVDDAVDWWLRNTRILDAERSIRRGKLPGFASMVDLDGLMPSLHDEQLSAYDVFGRDPDDAAAVVARARAARFAEELEEDALRMLGGSVRGEAGERPWELGRDEWSDRVSVLEYRIENEADVSAAELDEYDFLAPPDLREGGDLDDVFDRIRDAARDAGFDVLDDRVAPEFEGPMPDVEVGPDAIPAPVDVDAPEVDVPEAPSDLPEPDVPPGQDPALAERAELLTDPAVMSANLRDRSIGGMFAQLSMPNTMSGTKLHVRADNVDETADALDAVADVIEARGLGAKVAGHRFHDAVVEGRPEQAGKGLTIYLPERATVDDDTTAIADALRAAGYSPGNADPIAGDDTIDADVGLYGRYELSDGAPDRDLTVDEYRDWYQEAPKPETPEPETPEPVVDFEAERKRLIERMNFATSGGDPAGEADAAQALVDLLERQWDAETDRDRRYEYRDMIVVFQSRVRSAREKIAARPPADDNQRTYTFAGYDVTVDNVSDFMPALDSDDFPRFQSELAKAAREAREGDDTPEKADLLFLVSAVMASQASELDGDAADKLWRQAELYQRFSNETRSRLTFREHVASADERHPDPIVAAVPDGADAPPYDLSPPARVPPELRSEQSPSFVAPGRVDGMVEAFRAAPDNLRIRVPAGAVGAVLADGRIKSQFETGQSVGTYNPEIRRKSEADLHGIPDDVADSARPVYGYVEDGVSGREASDYGAIGFHVQPRVAGRTTVTFGDSLMHPGRAVRLTDEVSPTDLVAASNPFFQRGPTRQESYVEAQFHGGLSLDDLGDTVDFQPLDFKFDDAGDLVLDDFNALAEVLRSGRFRTVQVANPARDLDIAPDSPIPGDRMRYSGYVKALRNVADEFPEVRIELTRADGTVDVIGEGGAPDTPDVGVPDVTPSGGGPELDIFGDPVTPDATAGETPGDAVPDLPDEPEALDWNREAGDIADVPDTYEPPPNGFYNEDAADSDYVVADLTDNDGVNGGEPFTEGKKVLWAKTPEGQALGYLRYTLNVDDDGDTSVRIDMLRTNPEFARQGVGTWLTEALFALEGVDYTQVDATFTGDGAAFWNRRFGTNVTPNDTAVMPGSGAPAAARQPGDAPPVTELPDPGVDGDQGDYTLIGGQGGSNPGAWYSRDGVNYYVKVTRDEDHAGNEVAANLLYELAGANVPEVTRGADGRRIASRQVGESLDDLRDRMDDPDVTAAARRDFVADAWLANWDVAGMGLENIVVDGDGRAWRIDSGGALAYRARGDAKGAAFGDTVGELDSLRDPGLNPAAARVFGDVTDAELRDGAERVAAVSDDDIRRIVEGQSLDGSVADTLIARRDDIARRLLDGPGEPTPNAPDDADTPAQPLGADLLGRPRYGDGPEPSPEWAAYSEQVNEAVDQALAAPDGTPGKARVLELGAMVAMMEGIHRRRDGGGGLTAEEAYALVERETAMKEGVPVARAAEVARLISDFSGVPTPAADIPDADDMPYEWATPGDPTKGWMFTGSDDLLRGDPATIGHLEEVRQTAPEQMRVRVPVQVLESVLADGRWRTQFETGTSQGTYAPAMRRNREGASMGVPSDVPDAERPVYGYVGDPESGKTTGTYGEVIFTVKPKVAGRTTLTFGDSLGVDGGGAVPLLGDIDRLQLAGATTGMWARNPANPDGDPLRAAGYNELQFHGGLTLDDVETSITVQPFNYTGGPDGTPPELVPVAAAVAAHPGRVDAVRVDFPTMERRELSGNPDPGPRYAYDQYRQTVARWAAENPGVPVLFRAYDGSGWVPIETIGNVSSREDAPELFDSPFAGPSAPGDAGGAVVAAMPSPLLAVNDLMMPPVRDTPLAGRM
jgi:GNAT superfamily N-acetyltransferase